MTVAAEEDINNDAQANFSNEEDSTQYLTFIMADEEYGVDILSVQEIRGWDNVTPLPNSPNYIKGVINLRGTIVPIIDLRQCFGITKLEYGPLTVVIVLKIKDGDTDKIIGIVVDAVSDVYSISGEAMKDAPSLGDNVNTSYIRGLANIQNKMLILLEIDKLLSNEEISEIVDVKSIIQENGNG